MFDLVPHRLGLLESPPRLEFDVLNRGRANSSAYVARVESPGGVVIARSMKRQVLVWRWMPLIRRKLMLHYVANGQKVPEDNHAANPRYLLHRIFKSSPGDSAFTLQDAEFALIMASKNNVEPSRTGERSLAGFNYD